MSVFLAVLLLLMSSPAYGQAELRPSFIWGVARSTLLDPTTYVPAVVTYEATLADWKTSQPLFATWMGRSQSELHAERISE